MLRIALFLGFSALSLFLPFQAAIAQDEPLVANDDFYKVLEDSTLSVVAPGLLFNDDLSSDSLLVVLVTPPANGSVAVNKDGSFEYIPNPGFEGVDSFEYIIQTLPLQVLTVQSDASTLNFDMGVSLVLGSDDDNVDGRIGGTASFYFEPDTAPFSKAQLYDLDLQVIDPLELGFRFGGLITLGRLFVEADPNAFNLTLTERGETTEVINGLFTQSGKINVLGTVQLRGTGLISGEVPDEPQVFDTETDAELPLEVSLIGTTLSVQMPVFLEEAFELSGTDVSLKVEGSLLASAGLKQSVQTDVATVSITVDPYEDTIPVELTSFTGLVDGSSVALAWHVASEINNAGFQVERSTTQNSGFEKIGFVAGNGTSGAAQYSFADLNPLPGQPLYYRLKQIDFDGTFEYSEVVEVEAITAAVALHANYPNPFNPTTTITFDLPLQQEARLDVYDLMGRKIETLADGVLPAGRHEYSFDGSQLASGFYIYRLTTPGKISTQKMLLIK